MKRIREKGKLRGKRGFFAKIFSADVERQSKWVELFGLIGIIGFLIILIFSWAIKLDVTIPAWGKVKSINERIVIVLDISKRYAPVIEEGQKVKVYIKGLNRTGEILLLGKLSKLSEISAGESMEGEVIIDLTIKENIRIDPNLIQEESVANMRIVTSRRRILDFLISKKE